MTSMSYCVFENTVIDMQTCVSIMAEAADDGLSLTQFLEERGEYEAPAVRRLLKLAQEL